MLLTETAVFDYVAGHQSAETKRNFEELLEHDEDLKKRVQAERKLSGLLIESYDESPVAMSNFDSLLSSIEADEKTQTQNNKTLHISDVLVNKTVPGNNSNTLQNKYWGQIGIAASFMLFGVIAASFFTQLTEPKFDVLSDSTHSKEVEFTQLVEQRRLAILEFRTSLEKDLIGSVLPDVLQDYKLSTFEAGSGVGRVYVIAENTISQSDIVKWQSDNRIEHAEIIVFDGVK